MKKQFGLIGLGNFGRRVLEEMLLTDVEILIIDKDEELIEQYKNRVEAAYVADALKEEAISKIVPATIDGVIIDLVDKIEVSI
ncbi:MAG: NAD-binding protein, partial [Spirochaetia bacterium]